MTSVRGWSFWLCLVAGLALAVLLTRTPTPRAASAPATAFSADRAFPIVEEMSVAPHPSGSPANARVREALLRRMAALGLAPRVQAGIGVAAGRRALGAVAAGRVENLVGVLPGRNRTAPTLLLMAHYDSVPGSPGAADDATGVASMLETVRALKAGGPTRRDVVVAITDGEEAGLLGAELFFRADPLAARVGAVVNAEARGDAGRVAMFQTGPGDAPMVRLFADSAERPFGNSLTGYVYALLPNDTDFTHAVRRGLPGLNFAFIGDQLAYHTALATPAHLDRGSLQHMGGQILGVARALAAAPALPAPTHDVVYTDTLPGLPMLIYRPAVGWAPLAAAVALLLVGWRGRRERLAWSEVWRGLVAGLASVAGAVTVLLCAGWVLATGGLDELGLYRLLGPYDLMFAGATALAFGAAVAPLGTRGGRVWSLVMAAMAVLALLRGDMVGAGAGALATVATLARGALPISLAALRAGTVGLALLIAAFVQALAPAAAVLFAWPALAGALAFALVRTAPSRVGEGAAAVLAVAVLAVLGGWASQVFAALGPSSPMVLALFVPLLLPVFAPLATQLSPRGLVVSAAAALAFGAAAFAWAGLAPPTATRPVLTRADLFAEPAVGRYAWLAPGRRLDPWTRQLMGPKPVRAAFEPLFGVVWSAPSPPGPPLAAPALTLSSEGANTRITARAVGGGRELRLYLRAPTGLDGAALEGLPVALKARPHAWSLVSLVSLDAPGAAAVTLSVPARAVEAVLVEIRDGWPPGRAPPPKPPTLMGSTGSDLTYVATRARGP